jgi:hypothetical protein
VRALLDTKADISLREIQAELRQHGIVVGRPPPSAAGSDEPA